MRRRIACLHTAESNIPHFSRAAEGLGLDLHHSVRADLLAAAEAACGLTPDIVAATEAALLGLAKDSDLVLLACSTLGPIADGLGTAAPIRRVDRALAEIAVAAACKVAGSRVMVLYTSPTTTQATGDLFDSVAKGSGVRVDLKLVEGAWGVFKSGDLQRYCQMIAEAADDAFADGAASVAFAQASMSPAAELCRNGKAFASPYASLAMAVRQF